MKLIRFGDSGPEVRDVQRRLADLQLPVADLPGSFGDTTLTAVKTFQQDRSLPADGIVGPDTWRALVEAGFKFGDRLLYRTRPMLRGDDVRILQERLNRLGFDSGQVDGILGDDTRAAIEDFQLNAGLDPDGKAGPVTIAAIHRLHRDHQSTAASDVRERHLLDRIQRRTSLAGAIVLLDPGHGPDDPGFCSPNGMDEHLVAWNVVRRIHGRLAALGAHPVLSRGPATTPSSSERAALANREAVDVILSVHANGLPGSATAAGVAGTYFGSSGSTSAKGARLAELAVDRVCAATGSPDCRTHASTAALLRESRAAAAIVEIGFLTHPVEGIRLTQAECQATIAASLTEALVTYLLE